MQWQAARGERPDLVVQMRRDAGVLRVEAYTVRDGKRRAKCPNDFGRQYEHGEIAFHATENTKMPILWKRDVRSAVRVWKKTRFALAV
jgi:hypothetical protein